MKAITCSQCGALIKKISLKEKFDVCDYCGAKILLQENRDKIVEIPDENAGKKQLTPWQQYRENYEKVIERSKQYDNAPYTSPQETGMELSAKFGMTITMRFCNVRDYLICC